MSGLTDRLGDKVGPLPVWAWGTIAGGAILAGQYLYKRARPASDTAPASDTIEAGGVSEAAAPAASPAADEGLSFFAGGTYTPPAGDSFLNTGNATTEDKPTDNESWAQLAITRVVSRDGSLPVLLVTEAINKALNGVSVTEREAAIYEIALRLTGPPPYAVPTLTVIPTPSPVVTTPPRTPSPVEPRQPGAGAPAPPAPAVPSVVVKQGDTLWSIVRDHYGTATTARVKAVAAAQTPPLTFSGSGTSTQVRPFNVGQTIILPPGL